MKFRVLSDLHIDVNRDYDFFMSERDKGMFTVLAGDTSGDPLKTRQWIEQNLKEGVFVSGNHLVYNDRGKGVAFGIISLANFNSSTFSPNVSNTTTAFWSLAGPSMRPMVP